MTKLEGSIIKLRKDKYSVGRIAKELSCSKGTVSHYINKHNLGGVVAEKPIKSVEDFISDIPSDIINEVVRLRKLKKSYKEIHKLVNVSKDKITKICKLNGLERYVVRNNKVINDDMVEKIRNRYSQILNMSKVAREFDVSSSTVSKYCKDLVKNKPKVDRNKKNVEYVSNYRRKRKKLLIEYKGGSCQNCGYNKSTSALHFHHINPQEKDFTVSSSNYSFERMKKEVDKCLLVCSNCHCEIHDEMLERGYSDVVNKIIN